MTEQAEKSAASHDSVIVGGILLIQTTSNMKKPHTALLNLTDLYSFAKNRHSLQTAVFPALLSRRCRLSIKFN